MATAKPEIQRLMGLGRCKPRHHSGAFWLANSLDLIGNEVTAYGRGQGCLMPKDVLCIGIHAPT